MPSFYPYLALGIIYSPRFLLCFMGKSLDFYDLSFMKSQTTHSSSLKGACSKFVTLIDKPGLNFSVCVFA